MDRGPGSSFKGTDRLAVIVAIASLAAFAGTSPAGAAVTIGQLPPGGTPASACPGASTDYLQPSVTSGNLYVARQAGTIISWSTRASVGAGQDYVLKVFRRTADPDVFQVIEHAPSRTLTSAALNTFAVSLPVRSGDMLGFNAGGGPSACTFSIPGDTVISSLGDLPDGESGTFEPRPDSRLNLEAVLVPSNDFTPVVKRDRKRGTATLTAYVSNPGTVTLAGKGLKGERASKSIAVAGPVTFGVATAGKKRRRLERTGKVKLAVLVTFAPNGGDPSSQSVTVPLKKRLRRQLG